MSARSFHTKHRKQRKADFRSLWINRIGVAAKMGGLSYSKLIYGLQKCGSKLDRKALADLAFRNPASFQAVVATAKRSLAA